MPSDTALAAEYTALAADVARELARSAYSEAGKDLPRLYAGHLVYFWMKSAYPQRLASGGTGRDDPCNWGDWLKSGSWNKMAGKWLTEVLARSVRRNTKAVAKTAV